VRLAERHRNVGVAEQVPDGVDWDARHNQARHEIMPEVMPPSTGASEINRPVIRISVSDRSKRASLRVLLHIASRDACSLTPAMLQLQTEPTLKASPIFQTPGEDDAGQFRGVRRSV
jgi:hypothetical protein